MSIIFLTGFEHGQDLVSSGGGLASSTSGTCDVQSSIKRSGSYALTLAGSPATSYFTRTIPSSEHLTLRFYLYFISKNATTTVEIMRFSGSGTSIYLYYNGNAGGDNSKLQVYSSGGGNTYSSSTVSVSTWYRIDIGIDNTDKTFDWQIDGTDQTTHSGWTTAGNMTALRFNCDNTNNSHAFDDIIVTNVDTDYPIGEGSVEGRVTDTWGSSTNLSSFRDNGGSAPTDSATNPAYVELDEVPIGGGSDYIEQYAGASTDFVETLFADTTFTEVHGASFILAYQSAAASPGNSAGTKIIDGDNTSFDVYVGDMSETSMFYKSLPNSTTVITNPSSGWSPTTSNAMKGRIGYASDYAPIPRWHALFMEVDGTAGGDKTVLAGRVDGTLSVLTPTISTTKSITPTAGVVDGIFSTLSPTVKISKTVVTDIIQGAFSQYTPEEKASAVKIQGIVTGTLSTLEPTVVKTSSATIVVNNVTGTFTAIAPSILTTASVTALVNLVTGTLSTLGITVIGDVVVNVPIASGIFSTLDPTIVVQNPVPDLSVGPHRSVRIILGYW